MTESRLTQVARFGGLAFVVLAVGGFLAAGDAGLDNGAKIATYFADHRDRLLASYQIVAIGLLAFAVWAWSLMTTLERRDASSRNLAIAVFVSGAIVVAVEFGVVALFMTLALISDQPVDPQIARALANAAQVFSDMDYFPQALFFLALGLAILRTRLGRRMVRLVGACVGPHIAGLCRAGSRSRHSRCDPELRLDHRREHRDDPLRCSRPR